MTKTGERLAALRKSLNYTQKDIANILGTAASTISNYETGVHEPDLDTLCWLADFFHVSTDYLLGRTDLALGPDWLSQKLVSDMAYADILEILGQFDQEDCTYLAKTIRLIYYRHTEERKEDKIKSKKKR